MIDMIVNTIGAAVIAVLGYLYCRSGRQSFIVDGVTQVRQPQPAALLSEAGDLIHRWA